MKRKMKKQLAPRKMNDHGDIKMFPSTDVCQEPEIFLNDYQRAASSDLKMYFSQQTTPSF